MTDEASDDYDWLPERGTEACARFYAYQLEILDLLALLGNIAHLHAGARKMVEQARAEGELDEPDDDESHDVDALRLYEFVPLLYELMLTRTVDNFLSYVAELLGLAFKTQPAMLRAQATEDENISVQFILEHADMGELIAALVDRRVERMSYLGLDQLAKDVGRRFGFNLFAGHQASQMRRLAVTANEYRNTLVHNRGIVTRRFLDRTGANYRVGDRVNLNADVADQIRDLFERLVADIDHRASEHWKLPTVEFDDMDEYAPRRSAN